MILKSLQQKIKSLFFLLCLLFINSVEALKIMTSNLLYEKAYENWSLEHCSTQLLTSEQKNELKHLNLKEANDRAKKKEIYDTVKQQATEQQKTIKLAFEKRIQAFANFIQKEQPDVLCLQECDQLWQEKITQQFPEYECIQGETLKEDRTNLRIFIKKATVARALYKPKQTNQRSFAHFDAKILSVKLTDKTKNQDFYVLNIHAPWGQKVKYQDQTEIYKNCVEFIKKENPKTPIIAVGDWNTDGNPDETKTKEVLFDVFSPTQGFNDISQDLAWTARSVHDMDTPQKIDYVMTSNFPEPTSVTTQPPCTDDNFNLLAPHSPKTGAKTTFDPKNENNHWSDHAAIIVDFDTQQKTTKTKEQPAAAAQKKPGFAHKGKLLFGTTGLTMVYATHKICEEKLKGKAFSATEYAKTFVTTVAELATFQYGMKNNEQKIFAAALTTLIGGGIALNRN